MFVKGIWIHPWDVADIGAKTVVDEIAGTGFNSVSMAVRYVEERQAYPGPSIIYRNPRRKTYLSEGGVVYRQPAEHY